MQRTSGWIIVIAMAWSLLLSGCSVFNYMDRKRTMSMPCTGDTTAWMKSVAGIFDQHGYTVVDQNPAERVIVAQDSISQVEYRYTMLVRTWRVQHTGDSVHVDVYSVSTRMDGSDVTQTWDKRWSGEQVKAWMRPILTSLETSCGVGSPLMPGGGGK